MTVCLPKRSALADEHADVRPRFASWATITEYGSPIPITLSSSTMLGVTAAFKRAIEASSGAGTISFIATTARHVATETCAARVGPGIVADGGNCASGSQRAGSARGSGANFGAETGAAAAPPTVANKIGMMPLRHLTERS
jgi:hypothetical protein